MDAATQLRAIDGAKLTPPVRRALRSDTAEILDWQSKRLGGGFGNPVSLGLYRFSGTAQDRGDTLPWSLVLKMAQSPANVGVLDMGEGGDPTHWNYWKREMYLFQSDILDRLPPGLVAPLCFGVEERPGDVIWLWLEEIVDVDDAPWSLERHSLVARHFGRFNGVYLSGRPLPSYPWLSIGLLRQWCRHFDTGARPFYDLHRQPSVWEHPLVRRIYPPPDVNPFLHLLVDRKAFLAALDACPQTVCHRDAYPTNLMRRRGKDRSEETVALDWALAGIGPVGEELAQIVIGALDHADAPEAREVDELVFAGYLDGLRDSGWCGDARTARFGYVASAALRIGLLLIWGLNEALEESEASSHQKRQRNPLEDVIEQQVQATGFVLDLAEEAYDLLDRRSYLGG